MCMPAALSDDDCARCRRPGMAPPPAADVDPLTGRPKAEGSVNVPFFKLWALVVRAADLPVPPRARTPRRPALPSLCQPGCAQPVPAARCRPLPPAAAHRSPALDACA
eukprot:COSAG06_NODE_2372_length_6990_cov_6.727906_12_plen_108_part_00